MRAPVKLEVLLIQKELLGEAAELAEDVAADREGRAARVRDLLRRGELVSGIAIAPGPRESADVHDVAARVQEFRILQQTEACLDNADVRRLECSGECSNSTGLNDGVGIDEDEDIRINFASASVAACSEADVVGLDHA